MTTESGDNRKRALIPSIIGGIVGAVIGALVGGNLNAYLVSLRYLTSLGGPYGVTDKAFWEGAKIGALLGAGLGIFIGIGIGAIRKRRKKDGASGQQ